MERPRPQQEVNVPEYGLTDLTLEDAKKLTQALREEYGDEVVEGEDWFAEWVRFYQAQIKKAEEDGEVL
jgi:hypothetical protein